MDLEIKDIRDSLLRDKTDPYIKLTYGRKSYKTCVLDNAGDLATFNEVASFPQDTKNTALLVQVFDCNVGFNESLGEREIDHNKQTFSQVFDGTE